jgi:hypothetical protein
MLFFFSNFVVLLKVVIIYKNVLAKFGNLFKIWKEKNLKTPFNVVGTCDKIWWFFQLLKKEKKRNVWQIILFQNYFFNKWRNFNTKIK